MRRWLAALLAVACLGAGLPPKHLFDQPGAFTGWVDLSAGVAGAFSITKVGDATGTINCLDNVDPTYIRNGRSKNIRCDITGGTTSTTYARLIYRPPAKDFSQVGTVALRWWIDDPSTVKLESVQFDWSNDTGEANGFRFNPNDNEPLPAPGWNFHLWHRDQYTTAIGTPSWFTTMASQRIQVGANAGQTIRVYIDEVLYAPHQAPKVMPMFVGAYAEHYSTGFAELLARGMKGTLVVPTNQIGQPGRMTAPQITEMYLANWTVIHCGTDQSDDWKLLTQTQIEQKIKDAETVFVANGWTRDLKRIMLPGTNLSNTRYNSTVDAAMTARGIEAAVAPWNITISGGKHLSGLAIDPTTGIADQRYHLAGYAANNPEVLADVQALLRWRGASSYLPLFIGRITASPVSGEMATADYQSLVRTLYSTTGLGKLTWGQFLNILTTGRLAS